MAHVLADHTDMGIESHLFINGFPERIKKQGFGHGEGCWHK
jgi:hypothetical protein